MWILIILGILNYPIKKIKNSFFITATRNRYFKYFIEGILYLKNKSIDFEINVVGIGGFNK